MQFVRNLLFYWSPVNGAVLGGLFGLSFNKFTEVIEVLIGFGGGCVVSVFMIILSVRARFKADVTLTRNSLAKDQPSSSPPDRK